MFRNPTEGYDLEFPFPVDPTVMEGACLLRPQTDQWLVFFLPEGTAVYAAFAGRVRLTGGYDTPDSWNIQLYNERYLDSFIFVGESLVEDGAEVTEGQPLARLFYEQGPCYINSGNLGFLFATNAAVDGTFSWDIVQDCSRVHFR